MFGKAGTTTAFMWVADVVIHRGFVDGPVLMSETGYGGVDGPFTESAMEESAIEWLAECLEVDRADLEVVRFLWSDLEEPSPPPAP